MCQGQGTTRHRLSSKNLLRKWLRETKTIVKRGKTGKFQSRLSRNGIKKATSKSAAFDNLDRFGKSLRTDKQDAGYPGVGAYNLPNGVRKNFAADLVLTVENQEGAYET